MKLHANLATVAVFLLSHTRLTSASDPNPHIWPLDPWKITSLHIETPAENRSSGAEIALSIENPNTVSAGHKPHASGGGYLAFQPSAANCTIARVLSAGNSSIIREIHECKETTFSSYGVWSIGAIVPSGSNGFDVAFNLNYNVTRWNSNMYKVYDATAHLEVGKDLGAGVCSDISRRCSYGLKVEGTPVLVAPTMTACKGYCIMPEETEKAEDA